MVKDDLLIGIIVGFVLGVAVSNLIMKFVARSAPEKGMIYNYDKETGRLTGIFPASVPEG